MSDLPKTISPIYNCLEVTEDSALLVEGLTQYIDSLTVLQQLDDSFLRVMDPKTKQVYLIKKEDK